MNKGYVQGFMGKCAAAGIDPEVLLKRSGWLDNVKNVATSAVNTVTQPIRDVRDLAKQISTSTTITPKEMEIRKSRAAHMKGLGFDKDITPGGHLRGAGYLERMGGPNVEDILKVK